MLDVRSLIGLGALVRVGFTLEELEGLLSTFGPDLASTLDQASKDSADCWP